MEILEGYGLGPKIQRLLQRFWGDKEVVMKSGSYCGQQFITERGVTQGAPVPPTVFNIVVDSLVREVLLEI